MLFIVVLVDEQGDAKIGGVLNFQLSESSV